MRSRHLAVVGLLLSACGTPKGPKPGEVTAIGIATGIRSHNLARTTAQNRALSYLAQLLHADGINVELRVAGDYSALTLERPAGRVGMRQVDFTPLTNGWMARARARRSDVLMKRLQAMPAVAGEATVTHDDLGRALLVADARALRAAITAALPDPTAEGVHRGKLTLVDREVTFSGDDTLTVSVQVHLKHERVTQLDDGKRSAIVDGAAKEHAALGEWTDFIAARQAGIDITGERALTHVEIGDAYLELEDPLRAIEAYGAAAELEPKNDAHVKRQLKAAELAEQDSLIDELREKLGMPPREKPEPEADE